MGQASGERAEFAEFYKELNFMPDPTERAVCSGPIAHIGAQEVADDLQLYQSALTSAKLKPEEAFMCVLAPGWLEHFFHNEYYASDEQYLFALADAMKHEYKAIVDAGFILQIDDPALPDTYDMIVPRPTIEEYRTFAEVRVEAVNHALGGLPEDRVRYHICWGSWHGPHPHDLPLKHLVDLMLKVKAGAYSVAAANPRHEHEWKVWKEAKLPDWKVLAPGLIDTCSNYVEHPELIAQRIERFAGFVGPERVVASTDCGFGTFAGYGKIDPEVTWKKLRNLRAGADIAGARL